MAAVSEQIPLDPDRREDGGVEGAIEGEEREDETDDEE
jgi:hypothetical protein